MREGGLPTQQCPVLGRPDRAVSMADQAASAPPVAFKRKQRRGKGNVRKKQKVESDSDAGGRRLGLLSCLCLLTSSRAIASHRGAPGRRL